MREIAAVMKVTPRRIHQLRKHYQETGEIPELKQAGRKPKQIPKETEGIILQTYNKYRLSPVLLEKLIERLRHPHSPQHHLQSYAKTRFCGGEHEQEEEAKEVG